MLGLRVWKGHLACRPFTMICLCLLPTLSLKKQLLTGFRAAFLHGSGSYFSLPSR